MADAVVSKTTEGNFISVRLRSPAPRFEREISLFKHLEGLVSLFNPENGQEMVKKNPAPTGNLRHITLLSGIWSGPR